MPTEFFLDQMYDDLEKYSSKDVGQALSAVKKTPAFKSYRKISGDQPLGTFVGGGGFGWVEVRENVAFKIIPRDHYRLKKSGDDRDYSKIVEKEKLRLRSAHENEEEPEDCKTTMENLQKHGFSVLCMKTMVITDQHVQCDLWTYFEFIQENNFQTYDFIFLNNIHVIIEQIIETMTTVHSQDMYHGDIKPENILVQFHRGGFFDIGNVKVKLCDWGSGSQITERYHYPYPNRIDLSKISKTYNKSEEFHLSVAQDVYAFMRILTSDACFIFNNTGGKKLQSNDYYFKSFNEKIKPLFFSAVNDCWMGQHFYHIKHLHETSKKRCLTDLETTEINTILSFFHGTSLSCKAAIDEYALLVHFCLLSVTSIDSPEAQSFVSGSWRKEWFSKEKVHKEKEKIKGIVMNQYINHPRTWWSSLFHRDKGEIRAYQLITDTYSLKSTIGIDLLIRQEIEYGKGGNRDSSLKTILKNTMRK